MNFEERKEKDFGPNKQRRSRFELWSELLELCSWNARTQSWLIRKMGLNTRTIKEVLEFLLVRQLIKKVSDELNEAQSYLITEKGKEALKQYYLLISQFFSKK